MRVAPIQLVALLPALALIAACGDDGATQQGDVADATTADPDTAGDVLDSTSGDGAGDTTIADVPRDTSPRDTTNPQAGAWQTTWSARVEGQGARVLGLRYLGGQSSSSALLALEVGAGAAALDSGDGDTTELPGEGHRVVFVYLDPTSGNVIRSGAIELAESETVGAVTKAPNGFAVALAGETGRVALGQVFGTVLRVALVTIESEDHARLGLPASADLLSPTTGGGATPLALRIEAVVASALRVTVGEDSATLDVPAMAGVGFLTLAAATSGTPLPAEGHGLVTVDGLAPERVFETRSGAVLTVDVTKETTIGSTTLAAGRSAIVIGAVQEEGPIVPLALWQSAEGGASELDVMQVQSGGGGLVIAGVGEGRVEFGPDTLEATSPRDFIAALGSSAGIIYTASECDRIKAVTSGFQYRILKTTCDLDGQPALALTLLTTDFGGNLQEPFDLPLATLASDGAVTLHSGLVSLNVTDDRAYGALVDLGDGPRLVLVRSDGQPYDSGVLEALVRDGDSDEPIHFQPLRQGGFGGGGGATTNAFLFAVTHDTGPVVGRARIDLKTLIW
ncbi:MAG: hypothetical protein IT385_16340 [Deltaproteobacteria bacterium]|nr:hypothetical protein [Deltaproteobacteria bacterium]